MEYEETEYWNRRDNPNSAGNTATKSEIAFVRAQVQGCKRILDFGPGVGRIFPAYDGVVDHVEGYDISTMYSDRVMEKSKLYDFDFNLTIANSIPIMPYADNEFEAVVSVAVLLHQRPCLIFEVMRELVRVGKKVIIVSWYDPNVPFLKPGAKTEPDCYCFNYDYFKICNNHKWNIIKSNLTDFKTINFVIDTEMVY